MHCTSQTLPKTSAMLQSLALSICNSDIHRQNPASWTATARDSIRWHLLLSSHVVQMTFHEVGVSRGVPKTFNPCSNVGTTDPVVLSGKSLQDVACLKSWILMHASVLSISVRGSVTIEPQLLHGSFFLGRTQDQTQIQNPCCRSTQGEGSRK